MEQSSQFVRPQCSYVEVILNVGADGSVTSPTYFPVQKDLINRKVISIESFCDDDMKQSPINNTLAPIRAIFIPQVYVTLMREKGRFPGGDFYKNMPLQNFRRNYNLESVAATAPDRFTMDPEFISWNDSYITVTGLLQTADTPYQIVVPFIVSWIFETQDERPYTAIHAKK